jgi:hypothetical protein
MKILAEKNCKIKIVETKSGAKLLLLDMGNIQYLEQNPLKDSKYWIAYRKLKQIYPDIYMFWELKNWEFTGNLRIEVVTNKKWIDELIDSILKDESYKKYKDIKPDLQQ